MKSMGITSVSATQIEFFLKLLAPKYNIQTQFPGWQHAMIESVW